MNQACPTPANADPSAQGDRYLNADLHCHSNKSDGDLSPEDLVNRAVDKGVKVLALTDHDTLDGLAEARTAAAGRLTFVPGIEFSTTWNGIGVHILGLDFQPELLQPAVAFQEQVRQERAETIAQRLAKKGVENPLSGAQALAGEGQIGRPHFAKYLVQQGHFKREADAFKKWLGAGKFGDVKANWADLGQIIQWVKEAGGQAVIAHPHKYKMTNRKLRSFVEDFADLGGQGLEIASPGVTPTQRNSYVQLCQDFDLYGSRGSDFHTPNSPWTELGQVAALPSEIKPVWSAFKNTPITTIMTDSSELAAASATPKSYQEG